MAGRTPPSRWSWSSTLGARRSESGDSATGMARPYRDAAAPSTRRPPKSAPRRPSQSAAIRSMIKGCAAKSPPIVYAPSIAVNARSKRPGVVGVQFEQRLSGVDDVAGLRVHDHAGARRDRILLARPARAEPPGRDADGEGVQPDEHAVGRRDDHVPSPAPSAAARPDRRPEPRSCAATRPSPGRSAARRRDRRPPARPPASISRASARVSSTTSGGPPPASTSTDSATSSALPAVRPSGRRHVGQQRDGPRRRARRPSSTIVAGQLASVVDASS